MAGGPDGACMQVLNSPLLGPLARAAMRAVSSDLDPEEATPPITRLPFLGLPSPIPVPTPERLYMRCAPLLRADPGPAVRCTGGALGGGPSLLEAPVLDTLAAPL